jgi:uncharacterized protein
MTSSIYLFFLGTMAVWLSARVAFTRRRLRIGIGEGDNKEMKNAVRVFGNFIENTPLALLMLVCCEFRQAPIWMIHMLGLSMTLGRVLHFHGLSRSIGVTFGRTAGMALSYLSIFGGGLYLLVDFLRQATGS